LDSNLLQINNLQKGLARKLISNIFQDVYYLKNKNQKK